ncbi:hypothetical protein D3C71_1750370 [compost metagenome]
MAALLVLRLDEIHRIHIAQFRLGARHAQFLARAVAVPAVDNHPFVQGDGILDADVFNAVLERLELGRAHGRERGR